MTTHEELRKEIENITVVYDNGFGSLNLAEDNENGGNAVEYMVRRTAITNPREAARLIREIAGEPVPLTK